MNKAMSLVRIASTKAQTHPLATSSGEASYVKFGNAQRIQKRWSGENPSPIYIHTRDRLGCMTEYYCQYQG